MTLVCSLCNGNHMRSECPKDYWTARPGEKSTELHQDDPAEMLDSIGKLMDQVEKLKETLFTVMAQADSDLASAHAEICKLQNLDPTKHTWPQWTPQANSIRWHCTLREQFGLLALPNGE